MSSPTVDRLLSPNELADRYGLPVGSIYQWNYTNTGPPYIRVGRSVRYRMTDVLDWEDSRYVDQSPGRAPYRRITATTKSNGEADPSHQAQRQPRRPANRQQKTGDRR